METASDRLKHARARHFETGSEAARAHGWRVSTYLAHENGQNKFREEAARQYGRAFKVSWFWLLFGEGEEDEAEQPAAEARLVPIMGYIGAGAEIEPDFEQVPPDGLDQVDLPFPVPGDVIGLAVKGDSMLPRYDDGDVVVVNREQQLSTDSLIGDEAAVRTHEGRRFLKRIMPGPKPRTFNLESTNARTIVGARIAWASEIIVVVRAGQLRKAHRKPRTTRKPAQA